MYVLLLFACHGDLTPASKPADTGETASVREEPDDTGTDSEARQDDTAPPVDGDADQDGDGVPVRDDCNDASPEVYPGALEVCDGVDNDCDNAVDDEDADGPPAVLWYDDADGDGWGGALVAETCEDLSARAVTASGDCDDGAPAVNPAAVEVCNDLDDDCDALEDVDDPSLADAVVVYPDGDGDGYAVSDAEGETACEVRQGEATSTGDCDDADPAVSPGATELCDGGVDNDCDGLHDGQDDSVADAATWYQDADGDGYGDPAVPRVACNEVGGWVANDDDCDDLDAAVGAC